MRIFAAGYYSKLPRCDQQLHEGDEWSVYASILKSFEQKAQSTEIRPSSPRISARSESGKRVSTSR
jgi:hypothetical protein